MSLEYLVPCDCTVGFQLSRMSATSDHRASGLRRANFWTSEASGRGDRASDLRIDLKILFRGVQHLREIEQ